ncbi:putative electron transport protein YkgF [Escherichia coli]|uniref:Putative electron transport protein YkgF n=1 Tax=Escherichia coli TaxID=562 RepID=A0A376U2Z4_ECOLX|nr:putative electron transport protein YkgF [Escherichia coli]
MVTEEIGVNHVLQDAGIQVIETDLGEYILQLDQDPPSHVVVPAIHKDRHQIRRVLHERLGYEGRKRLSDDLIHPAKNPRRFPQC